MWVINKEVLRKLILDKGTKSKLSFHPESTKMYQDLRIYFGDRVWKGKWQSYKGLSVLSESEDRTSMTCEGGAVIGCADVDMGQHFHKVL